MASKYKSINAVGVVWSFEGEIDARKVQRVPSDRTDFVDFFAAGLEALLHPLQ